MLPRNKRIAEATLRILGVYPQQVSPQNLIARSTFGEPIGLARVLAVAASQGHDVTYIPLITSSIADLTEKLIRHSPDICLLSFMTCQLPSAKLIASTLKERDRRLVVVGGGYHPSSGLELDDDFDIWVHGEGELTIQRLLARLDNGATLEGVEGISFRDVAGRVHKTPAAQRISDLDCFPPALRSVESVGQKYYGLVHPIDLDQTGFAYVEFGRGCYYDCDFCCKDAVLGSSIIYRAPSVVVDEMLMIRDNYGANLFFFCDLNFTAHGSKVVELCNEMIAKKLDTSWFCMSNLSNITPPLLNKMRSAGCVKIMYGLESISKHSLEESHKPHSSRSFGILQDTSEAGILVQVFYMMGFPWESGEQLINDIPWISQIPAHQIRIGIATPFPGTRWFSNCERKDLAQDWTLYDSEHLVYRHNSLDQNKLSAIVQEAYRSFYLSKSYSLNVSGFLQSHKEYSMSFDRYLSVILEQGLFTYSEMEFLKREIGLRPTSHAVPTQ